MDAPKPIPMPVPIVMPAAPRTPVVVTVSPAGWRCEYKGAVLTLPASVPAAEVERRAGQWGLAVDTTPPVTAPSYVPAAFPFRLGTTCVPGGT